VATYPAPMTFPSGSPTRRRARSPRVLAALVSLAVAGALVVGAALSGSWLLLAVAAAASVVLGAVATRTTYTELSEAWLDAARDRAELAKDYRDLTVVRTAEHQRFVDSVQERVAAQEARITGQEARLTEQEVRLTKLNGALEAARTEAGVAQRRLVETTARAERAEGDRNRLAARVEDVEDRAAQAALRVVELEQEVDVLTAQWQAREAQRKHA
jgi:chromosome segregation ATPase